VDSAGDHSGGPGREGRAWIFEGPGRIAAGENSSPKRKGVVLRGCNAGFPAGFLVPQKKASSEAGLPARSKTSVACGMKRGARTHACRAETRLTGWTETKLEDWLKLEINGEKTRVVNRKEEGASLDFLGFTFRFYDDLKGRGWRY